MICEAPPAESAERRSAGTRPLRTATRDRRDLFRGRWAVATAGTLMMVCLGTVYSWSIFARPLIAAFHWSATTTMWTFSTAIFALGLGAVIGGRIQDRIGPRNVALAGVVLWAFGNILAGLLTTRLGAAALYVTYGVIGGFGLGMAYVSPVAMVTKWFPGHRGLASGLVLTGFGLGAFFYNALVSLYAPFARATTDAAAALAGTAAMTAADVDAVMTVFIASGVCYLVIGGLCALTLRDPREPGGRRTSDPSPDLDGSLRPRQVLRTRQFYMLWFMLFVSVTAGIALISNAVPIFVDLTGAAPTFAAPLIGLLAVFNGAGRIFWGHISDRIGRNTAFLLILGIQAAVFAVMPTLHATVIVCVAFAIVLLCNGGSFGTMPAFNADYFGTRYLGLNYGMILTAWGVAGVVGPLIAARVKDLTGSYAGTTMPLAVTLATCMLIPIVLSKPGEASLLVRFLRRRFEDAKRIHWLNASPTPDSHRASSNEVLCTVVATKRLRLVAATPQTLAAEGHDRDRLAALLGAAVPAEWPPSPSDDLSREFRISRSTAEPDGAGWATWYFVRNEPHAMPVVIGNGRFKGTPSADGIVEVGCSLFPHFQHRGYASEAVAALIEWASAQGSVQSVRAERLPRLDAPIASYAS